MSCAPAPTSVYYGIEDRSIKNINMNKFTVIRSYWISHILKRNMCKVTPDETKGPSMSSLTARYRPSELQKFILVWTKKFKTKEEIPKFISADLIDRSRSEARIKLANILMVLTVLGSFGAIIAGKRAAKQGDSVHQMNLDWHKKYQEEYQKKEEDK